VLEGADFKRFRPRALVVEAIDPGDHRANQHEWEHLVQSSGYCFVLFDGVNRVYTREDDPELGQALSVSANVLDEFVAVHQLELERQAEALNRVLESLNRALVERDKELNEARATLTAINEGLARTRTELARSRSRERDGRLELDAARAALEGDNEMGPNE
jgi:hypothetical protein